MAKLYKTEFYGIKKRPETSKLDMYLVKILDTYKTFAKLAEAKIFRDTVLKEKGKLLVNEEKVVTDHSGKESGFLLIKEFKYHEKDSKNPKRYKYFYNVLCHKCEKSAVKMVDHIVKGGTKSCCLNKLAKRPIEAIQREVYRSHISNAKAKGRRSKISFELPAYAHDWPYGFLAIIS